MLASGAILRERYEIEAAIGQGGMGAVYLASDRRLPGRRCAVKAIRPLMELPADVVASLRQQFLAEAMVLARLDHPALPKVSDYFSQDGADYLVMDFVPGQDLAEVVKETRRHGRFLPESQVLSWAETLCDALTYMHLQEPPVLHRDIKPANTKLLPDGRLKLVDFGLAHTLRLDSDDSRTLPGLRGTGSLPYLPLEQYGAELAGSDPRADIYALSATLYHLLTGRQPLSAQERFLKPNDFPMPRMLNPAISPAVERAILRGMSLRPDDRPSTAAELKSELFRTSTTSSPTPAVPLLEALQANWPLLLLGLCLFVAALVVTFP